MTKLSRNISDAQSREFWESVDKGAAEIANAPQWMEAGIVLNERHFHAFATRRGDVAETVERPADGE